MKFLRVAQVRQVINGALVQGSDNFVVRYVPYYFEQLQRRRPNALVFLRKKITQKDYKTLQTGLPCAVVTDADYEGFKRYPDLVVIKVENIETAYWTFVQYYRHLFNIPVVAITGTCGKTSTKEMITHVLKQDHQVHSTYKSANSRLAYIHYLTGIDDRTEYAVFETAVGKPGDIKQACEYYKPTIGLITNIGEHHLDGCKTLSGYIKAKAEILDGLDNQGTLVLNADDENIKTISLQNFKGKVLYFGQAAHSDFRIHQIQFDDKSMTGTLEVNNKTYQVKIPGFGEHQIYNATGALVVLNELGIDLETAISYLSSYQHVERQLELSKGLNGATIIDDTWSLNTTSLEAALKVLHQMGTKSQKKLAIFTDIAHLGERKEEVHRKAGDLIAKYGLDTLITLGTLSMRMGDYAVSKGLKGKVYSLDNFTQARRLLHSLLNSNSILLIKGNMTNKELQNLAKDLKGK